MNGPFAQAFHLLATGDREVWFITGTSLRFGLFSTLIACVPGIPLGVLIALKRFPLRRPLLAVLNTLMALPTVVVGLLVYSLISRSGPLGSLGILFTPAAIVVAQTVLVVPIVAALARQTTEDAWNEYREQLTSLGVSRLRAVPTVLWDTRFSLLTVVMAGFGRAASEVGAVMVVGGNIDGVTRVMTTAIALETSKGDLPLALALGVILIGVVLAINAGAYGIREWSARHHG